MDVLRGAALLLPPGDDERSVLEEFGDDPTRRRLACSVETTAGEGLIELRACDD